MAFSIESTLGELLDNPEASAVLDKHIPGISADPQIGMARGFALSMAASMSGGKISQDALAAINKDLGEL